VQSTSTNQLRKTDPNANTNRNPNLNPNFNPTKPNICAHIVDTQNNFFSEFIFSAEVCRRVCGWGK